MFKEKRGKFYFRINVQERALLEEKANQYGYQDLGTYIRDACIYENILVENLEGKKEIMERIDLLNFNIKQYEINLEKFKKKNLSTYDFIEINNELSKYQKEILQELKTLKQVINDKLFVNKKKEYFEVKDILGGDR